jgi:glutathione peroxidase
MKETSMLRRSVVFSVVCSAVIGSLAAISSPAFAEEAEACPAILNHKFNRLQDDVPQDLCQYKGKVALVVNTASYCGFTNQYEGLEKAYAKYSSKVWSCSVFRPMISANKSRATARKSPIFATTPMG